MSLGFWPTFGSQQMFKVMSLHVDAGLKSLPALSPGLSNWNSGNSVWNL